MEQNNSRPVKRVTFSPEDTRIVKFDGGGPSRLFKDVTDEFRNKLILQIEDSITNLLDSELESFAMIVELESEALAKSHRPISIFNDNTCPFIGDIGIDSTNKVGRFLVKATRNGLMNLYKRISEVSANSPLAALSTVKNLRTYYPNINISHFEGENDFVIRLIHLLDYELDRKNEESFYIFLHKNNVKYNRISNDIPLFRVQCGEGQDSFDFLEQVNKNPIILSVQKAKSFHVTPLSLSPFSDEKIDLNPPDDELEYPVVGVVDTAINSNCQWISPWYVGEETAIIEEDKDYSHGTFVAGLISNAIHFNGPNFPKSQSKVFSVGALTSEGGSMEEILSILERAQEEHPEIKVWNLSLGADQSVPLDRISEFAILLDQFQEKYNSLCVISAGNINNIDYVRLWPPSVDCPKEEQRITSPGDSVLGITVASLAHVDGIVLVNEPSIFSRSGPVANLVLKPDLSHYGGNHQTLSIPLGVNSLSTACQLSQDCGTSFSTPLVSTIAANLWQVMGEETKRHTIKGLLTHSARLRHEIPNEHKLYYGWGMPLDVEDYMYCRENEITLIFEGDIGSNSEVVSKLPFPMPESLRTADGKIKGEFFMTICYDSPLDYNRAFEYCLVNLEVGLGEVLESGEFTGKIPSESTGFEQELINGRYKWSPIKIYHKKFPNGVNVEDWKLQVKMITRAGYEPPENFRVPFSIILTIRALEPDVQIYDEMVRLMNQYNWQVENAVVPIEPRIKL